MAAIFFFIIGIVLIAGGIFFIYKGYQTLTASPSSGIPWAPKDMEKALAVIAIIGGLALIGFGIVEIVGAFSAA